MAPKRAREDVGDSDDDFKPGKVDVDSDEEQQEKELKSPKKSGKGGKGDKKVKQGGGGGGKPARKAWTDEELRALWQGIGEVAMENISRIKGAQKLGQRDPGNINHKVRSELKKKDQELGGDGKWVDDFKLAPSPSKKGSKA